ncbi:strictosidine synthase [Deinococcus koreensis]|uniref:Strictosidine synthase n=1 Tax=Deinococcus koreensis TaxID=2054903 RepID=A0A2K3UTR1_9DEIO|nr:strictosidine synthase [Deinococcus koreensis]
MLLGLGALGGLAGLAWLRRTPAPIQARAWAGLPPAPPADSGPYADNGRLEGASLFDPVPGRRAPESTAVDAQGRVYASFDGGMVYRFAPDGTRPEPFADTGGRPLGLRLHPDGDLLVADALKGLLRCTPGGEVGRLATVTVLADSAQGLPLGFTDDLDIDSQGRYVYFTDASSRYRWPDELLDLLEHGGHGRVLRHDLQGGETTVLRSGLNFPNGVTLTADGSALLVTETGAACIHRLWLSGPQAGVWDVFVANLPGYPDNIRADGQGTYWVALPSRRTPLLDATARLPWLRDLVARLLAHVKLPLKEEALLVALDDQGQVVAYATGGGPGTYSYITQVLPHGGDLLLSSLHQPTVARIPLSQVRGERA